MGLFKCQVSLDQGRLKKFLVLQRRNRNSSLVVHFCVMLTDNGRRLPRNEYYNVWVNCWFAELYNGDEVISCDLSSFYKRLRIKFMSGGRAG